VTLDQAFSNGISHELGQQSNRADSVVIPGDGVVEIIGVGVGVKNSNNRNPQLLGFVDREVFAKRVDDPDRIGGFGECANSTE